MKTFVKIPLSDWGELQFEVPIARGNLHSRSKMALLWLEKNKPFQPSLRPTTVSATLNSDTTSDSRWAKATESARRSECRENHVPPEDQ